jgi:hypothetical protein
MGLPETWQGSLQATLVRCLGEVLRTAQEDTTLEVACPSSCTQPPLNNPYQPSIFLDGCMNWLIRSQSYTTRRATSELRRCFSRFPSQSGHQDLPIKFLELISLVGYHNPRQQPIASLREPRLAGRNIGFHMSLRHNATTNQRAASTQNARRKRRHKSSISRAVYS